MSGAQQVLTWTVLLSRWMEFAKSSVALPKGGEAGRVRRAVPALIGLQAVTYALAEVPLLPSEEQSFARDRAEVLIKRYQAELHGIWEGEPLPEAIEESVSDALASLAVLEASLHNWA
ncbi:MAG TPA: hypothetical protein VD997_17655 [Phycisphaerales bacterium]|nr:hypothetical protein [Phycisphaerales bacterium]